MFFFVQIGTIDKEHLNLNIENLQENTAYTFKFDNRLSPSMDNQNNVVQEFQFQTFWLHHKTNLV